LPQNIPRLLRVVLLDAEDCDARVVLFAQRDDNETPGAARFTRERFSELL